MNNNTCHKCRFYSNGDTYNHCLIATDNPFLENEKLKYGLIGECDDFVSDDVKKMKSFDEWFEEKYNYMDVAVLPGKLLKIIAFESWQAAQEVQRESDAVIAERESTLFSNVICEKIVVAIRNNKEV